MNWHLKKATMTWGVGAVLALGLTAGCGDTTPAETGQTDDGVVKGGVEGNGGGKGDAWNSRNDPARFNAELEYTFDELPTEGYSERVAWADTYWPTYEDGINARWQGEGTLSPAEKYDKAFHGWSEPDGFMELKPFNPSSCEWDDEYYAALGPVASYASANMGNRTSRNGRDDDGDGLSDAEECGWGDENKDRDGVESWWGLCHAWVPAAMLEDEPLRPVACTSENDCQVLAEGAETPEGAVRFDVSDIKALIISQYNRADAYMLGGRCNAKEVERDEETGRVTNSECRDLNAGTFHVIMANFLGVQRRAVAEDRTYNYEVWNQPVVGFKVTEQNEITLAEAHELLRVTTEDDNAEYAYNEDAVKFIEIKAETDYITESHASTRPNSDHIERYTRTDSYHYIVELDDAGEIIGGEWLGDSIQDHPDFLWLPTRARGGNPNIDTELVRELIAISRQDPSANDGDDGATTGGQASYSSTERVAIPDNDAQGVTTTIEVTDSGTIAGLKVDLAIDHTYRGDLVVELEHNGTTALVFNGREADQRWEDNVELTDARIQGFEGLDMKGTWTLKVSDNARVDTGAVTGWTLDIETAGAAPEPQPEPQPENLVEAENTDTTSIPDNDAQGVTSTIVVADERTIAEMTLDLEITHTYRGDLLVTLTHGETTVTVFDGDNGGRPMDDDVLLVDQVVDGFAGQSTKGEWTLKVVDRANVDEGQIDRWGLTFAVE